MRRCHQTFLKKRIQCHRYHHPWPRRRFLSRTFSPSSFWIYYVGHLWQHFQVDAVSVDEFYRERIPQLVWALSNYSKGPQRNFDRIMTKLGPMFDRCSRLTPKCTTGHKVRLQFTNVWKQLRCSDVTKLVSYQARCRRLHNDHASFSVLFSRVHRWTSAFIKRQ